MYLIAIYTLIFTIPKIYLSLIEIKFINNKKNNEAYILNKNDFKKAADYSIKKEKISIISSILDLCLFTAWIVVGINLIENIFNINEFANSVIVVLLFLIINTICNIPLEAYIALVLDKNFGFSKNNLKLFMVDTIKSLLLLVVIGGLLISALVAILTYIDNWEIYTFVLIAIFILGANLLYPTVIAPMFNKFTILEDESLNRSINELLNKAGFNSNGIFVMDASKRDGRLNAYFGGFGKTKRVILFDTLLDKITKDSLLAVLGHELGHFKNNDIPKMIALMLSLVAILLFIISNIPSQLFTYLNISQSPHTTIIFLILFSNPIGFIFNPIISFFSCKNEYNADKFGASLTSNEALANALLILVKENKSFPLAHPLYMRFYYTHPPLMARLEALNCSNLAIQK